MRFVVFPAFFLSSAFLAAASVTAASGPWQPLPEAAPAPANNLTTPTKVELGKMLYFDTRLSSSGNVSCFSCHNVMEGGDDHRPTSIGVHGHVGGRNAPSVWNAAFLSSQFWTVARRRSKTRRKDRRQTRSKWGCRISTRSFPASATSRLQAVLREGLRDGRCGDDG